MYAAASRRMRHRSLTLVKAERRARDHPGGKTSGIRQMSDILHQSKVIVCEDR